MNNRQTNQFPSNPFQTNTVSQFPGLEEDQVQRLKQTVDSMGIKDIYEKQRKEQELYRKVIEAKQQKDTFDKRNAIKNSLYSDSIKQPDPVKRNISQAQVRMEDLADIVKQKYNLQANAPTNEVLQGFSKMLADQGVDPKLTNDYLNGRSEELLYVSGLKERPPKTFWQQLKEDAQSTFAPAVGFAEGVADVGQVIGKPVEKITRGIFKMFGYTDEELDAIGTSTKSGLSDLMLGEEKDSFGAKAGKELGKIAGSAFVTGGIGGGVKMAGLGGKELLKAVAKRTLAGASEGLLSAGAYNMADSGKIGDPVNLGVAGGIGAVIGGPLNLLGNRVIVPGISKLANKLQLSGLLNRTRLDRLQTILKQGGSEDLAQGKAEDVANWMFQRDIRGTKEQILKKLDNIAKGADDLLEEALSKSTRRIESEPAKKAITNLYNDMKTIPGLESEADDLLRYAQQQDFSLSDLQTIKKKLDNAYNLYTKAGGETTGLKAEGLRNIRSEIKKTIETVAEEEGLSEIGVKLLNNEKAMATSMKQAITEKLNTDMIGEILSFVSNRGGTSVGGALLGSQVGPFNNDSIEGKLGNIVFGFAAGRFLGSTQAKTFTAGLLKKLNSTQKAEILNYINKPKSVKLSDKTSKILLNELNKIDDSINLPNNIYDDVNNINVGPSVKSQSESIPQLKATVKAPEDPLIAEARKYKSAEEFVNTKMYEKPKYGMSHRPTFEGSPPAHNLLEGDMLPRDVYSKPEWSIASMGMKDPAVKESRMALQKIKGNPEMEITVYRASPKNELNIGDWVSFSKKYAEGEGIAEGSKAYAYKVKAKDVYFAGDDINEFGYFPKDKLKQIREEANKGLNPKTKNDSISRPVVRMKDPEELYHTSTKEIGKLTDDKVLWTTPDSKYTLKYGKEGSRNTYKINSEGLNILDGTSKKGIDIIESINKKLGDKGFSAGVLSDDGKVVSFVLKDKNIIAELKKMGYDGLRTTESFLKGGAESVGIINPSKVKGLESTSKGLKPKK